MIGETGFNISTEPGTRGLDVSTVGALELIALEQVVDKAVIH